MKPVVAAPLPRAAARARTSSREVITTEVDVLLAGVDVTEDVTVVDVDGAAGAEMGADGITTDGVTEGCLIAELCLLKSSRIPCWSAFFRPYNIKQSDYGQAV